MNWFLPIISITPLLWCTTHLKTTSLHLNHILNQTTQYLLLYPDSTTATNTYAVQGNLLLTTGTEANLKSVVQNLNNVLKNVTYTPVSYTHLF